MSDFFAQSAQRLYRFLGRLLSGVEDFFYNATSKRQKDSNFLLTRFVF